jgi:hypothetical protein
MKRNLIVPALLVLTLSACDMQNGSLVEVMEEDTNTIIPDDSTEKLGSLKLVFKALTDSDVHSMSGTISGDHIITPIAITFTKVGDT